MQLEFRLHILVEEITYLPFGQVSDFCVGSICDDDESARENMSANADALITKMT